MRYKPLLLALLLCFAAPTFAANDAPKEKAVAKKTSNSKKTDSKKDADKAADKKANSQAKSAQNKDSSKNEKSKTKEKNDGKQATKTNIAKDNKNTQKDKNKNETAAPKANKAEAKKAVKEKEAAAKENNKTKAAEKTGKDKKDSPKNDKKAATDEVKSAQKNKKTAADDTKSTKKDKKAEATKERAKKEAVKAEAAKTKDKATEKKAVEKKAAASHSNNDDEVRAAVSAATNDLEAKQALQKRTAAFLVRVNGNLKELQQTRSNLSNINRQQRDAWNKLQQLDKDLSRLKAEVGNTRAQISRFVSGNYKNSQPNAVALFLKNAEPGQKTRFLRYTRYINSANEKVVQDLAKQQKELVAQENKINNELSRLKKLQANAQATLKKQGAKNTPEQVESRRQNANMAKDAKKAVNQKDNEQRLNNLLKDLDKQKAEQRKKEAEARKKAAEARLAAAERNRKANEKKAAEERAALSNLTDEDMKLQAPTSGSFVTVSNPNSFSRMQGRLKKPVNGMLSGLFGHSRDNGDVWKGVFYNTAPTTVNSIAAGNVVYADALEGYGNVVVVDHGDHYVSVYSGLSEIGVAKGYSVGENHKIGTSGALPSGEEGLYLEIRYNGQNMNPLSWVN